MVMCEGGGERCFTTFSTCRHEFQEPLDLFVKTESDGGVDLDAASSLGSDDCVEKDCCCGTQ